MQHNKKLKPYRDGDYYVLNGMKNWITNGTTADYYLVQAMTDKEKGYKGITTFIVEKESQGFGQSEKKKINSE